MLGTPVLLIVFNRLDTLKEVFAQVKRASPIRLFIAADGPRAQKEGEREKCEAVRKYILDNIDWPCEVRTMFREENLGCGKAVSGAITWFFSQVEEGIILEDDCVPSNSFFRYCEELLERYRDNDRIMHIAGHNPLGKNRVGGDSYYFARIQHCWGWASWQRAWSRYSFDIQGLADFRNSSLPETIFPRKISRDYWLRIFERMERHEIDTWDYQWVYAILRNDGVTINPARNLVSNIGFGSGTHTMDIDSPFANQKRFEMDGLIHPSEVSVDARIVERINRSAFGLRNDPIGKMLRPFKAMAKSILGYSK